jgi:hypothetical protein
MASAGYAQTPLPGDRLRALGVNAVRISYRGGRGGPGVDVVLVGSEGAYRKEIPLASPDAIEVAIPFRELTPDRGVDTPPESAVFRFLRFEAPRRGFEVATTIDVAEVDFLPMDRRPAPRDAPPERVAHTPERTGAGRLLPAAPSRGVVAREGRLYSDSHPFFPFGVFLLGGNRSRLERIGVAGANAVVEYGPAMWPLFTVEDHLDYARCAGVRVGLALTNEKHGRLEISDSRLAPLAEHRDLLAWYLFDEPDGGTRRGFDAADCSAERLRTRRDALGGAPVLITCLNSFGLRRYAETADILATDFYWPAWGPNRSLAVIHSNAEAVVEIASDHDAVPTLLLQLGGEKWSQPDKLQTASSLNAQVLAALAAGVRGIFLFEGVTPMRWSMEGRPEGEIWDAFLELSGRVATWGPLAARWSRIPGEPKITPALGDVRASCFREGDSLWMVMVNLGDRTANVVLEGECLQDAIRLEDPGDGWRKSVEAGRWSGKLAPREGRVARIVSSAPAPSLPAVVENITPPAIAGADSLRYDRAVLGATLYPAP